MSKFNGLHVVAVALLLGLFGSTLVRAEATVGAAAPGFSLQDQNGNMVTLDAFKGKIVVLEWFNNECPFVQKFYSTGAMNTLAGEYTSKGVVWLAINSTKGKENADNKSVAGEWKIDRPILNDSAGVVGHAYGAKTTPHMFIVGADGTLVYAGAIDDKKSSETSDLADAKNYVRAALDEALAGKPVTTSSTKSYGCSVKYAK